MLQGARMITEAVRLYKSLPSLAFGVIAKQSGLFSSTQLHINQKELVMDPGVDHIVVGTGLFWGNSDF